MIEPAAPVGWKDTVSVAEVDDTPETAATSKEIAVATVVVVGLPVEGTVYVRGVRIPPAVPLTLTV